MNTIIRAVGAVISLLIALAMTAFTVMGFFVHQWLLAVVCGVLAAAFGYFIYHDYQYFFGQKTAPPPPPPPAPPPARGMFHKKD